jgi:hypothetical protein
MEIGVVGNWRLMMAVACLSCLGGPRRDEVMGELNVEVLRKQILVVVVVAVVGWYERLRCGYAREVHHSEREVVWDEKVERQLLER